MIKCILFIIYISLELYCEFSSELCWVVPFIRRIGSFVGGLCNGRFDVPVVVVTVVVNSMHIFLSRVGCDDSFVWRFSNFFMPTLFSNLNWGTCLAFVHGHTFKKLFLKFSLKNAYKIGFMAELEYPENVWKKQTSNKYIYTLSLHRFKVRRTMNIHLNFFVTCKKTFEESDIL